MSETSKQWIQGCAIGCAALLVFGVFLLVGMTFSMRSVFKEAHSDRQVLNEQFGEIVTFTPMADGSVPADRVEVFLSVREALEEIHSEIEEVDREVADFEELDENGEPSLTVALPAIAGLTKSMIGLPKVFGEVEQTRNRALVEAGMGLGEYTYIYVMAFHRQIVAPETEAHLFSGSAVNRRIRADLRGMIERQLQAARSAATDDAEWIAALDAEIEVLVADEDRIPWADGLPSAIAASFDDARDRLEATYSAAAAEFELINSEVKHGGLQITAS